MDFNAKKTAIPAAAFMCLLMGTTGCNVDRAWPDRQAPVGMNPTASNADVGLSSDGDIDVVIADVQEVDLIEAVVSHRSLYHRNLAQLREYYEQHGYATKEKWAAFELAGLKDVASCQYLMDAEVPSNALRPTDRIEQADALYAEGLALMKRGGHGIPALYSQNHMIQAAKLFKQLIELYPSSDKIDDAAFYCGEIHKEYLPGKETIAVKWYERAWTWDPQTDHPARFQAAVVYDYRLHDRDRALELYHGVIDHETAHKSNVRFASRRIHELTAGTDASRAARP
jgi:tetratricopeptide (TPR) repeat protein